MHNWANESIQLWDLVKYTTLAPTLNGPTTCLSSTMMKI